MVLLALRSFVLLLTAHPLGPPSQPASQTHQTVRDPQLYCSCPHSLLAHHQTSSSSISFASIPRSIITTSYHSSDPCRLSNRERKGMHHPLNAFSPILAPRPALRDLLHPLTRLALQAEIATHQPASTRIEARVGQPRIARSQYTHLRITDDLPPLLGVVHPAVHSTTHLYHSGSSPVSYKQG